MALSCIRKSDLNHRITLNDLLSRSILTSASSAAQSYSTTASVCSTSSVSSSPESSGSIFYFGSFEFGCFCSSFSGSTSETGLRGDPLINIIPSDSSSSVQGSSVNFMLVEFSMPNYLVISPGEIIKSFPSFFSPSCIRIPMSSVEEIANLLNFANSALK